MSEKKRIREWMDIPGRFLPGARNTITDVPGVTVGHCTVIEGEDVRTGVTVIKPHAGDPYRIPVPCAIYVANGFGKLTGSVQVNELGELESLIGLTNTFSVCQAVQGILNHQVKAMLPGDSSMNVVVGETNDHILNDLRGFHVTPEHVRASINALSEEVGEGNVGAGTGTRCYGYKGGIGTASRVVSVDLRDGGESFVAGALVQTNFGGNLNLYGWQLPYQEPEADAFGGSCMIVVATNAPLDARQLMRVAKRGIVGMTMTGSYLANDSGDFCIAFSNARQRLAKSDRTERFRARPSF